jgi:hypothetical protein
MRWVPIEDLLSPPSLGDREQLALQRPENFEVAAVERSSGISLIHHDARNVRVPQGDPGSNSGLIPECAGGLR